MSDTRGPFGFIMNEAGGESVQSNVCLQLIVQTLRLMVFVGALHNKQYRQTIKHNTNAIMLYVIQHPHEFTREHNPVIYFTLRAVPNQEQRTTYADLFAWLLSIAHDMQDQNAGMNKEQLERMLKETRRRQNRRAAPMGAG